MRDVKNPAAAWTTATGNIPKKITPNNKAEEVNLQLLASILQSGESVQIAPGLWFTIPSPVQFDPHPAPEGWQEEFGQAHVHPLQRLYRVQIIHDGREQGPGRFGEERVQVAGADAQPEVGGVLEELVHAPMLPRGARGG